MGALVVSLLLATAATPVALLPPDLAEPLHDSARATADALAAALPPPFQPLDLDARAVREHLAAAGPACRAEHACLCAAAGLVSGQLALDLGLAPAGPGAWAVDLRVLAPCDGRLVDRRAEIIPAGIAGLRRFLDEVVPALLRGRDLPEIPVPKETR
jgi:hypothetical protein